MTYVEISDSRGDLSLLIFLLMSTRFAKYDH